MKNSTLRNHYFIAGIISIVLIFIDQITKYLTITYLKDTEGIDIIDDVFRLQYLENRGAAFGIFQNQQTYFIIMTSIVLIGIVYLYSRIPFDSKFHPLRGCLILLISGAIGNYIDRIRLNFVVDFLYFELIDFPIFNVADIYVTVTVAIFALLILFYYKEDDLERIKLFGTKKSS